MRRMSFLLLFVFLFFWGGLLGVSAKSFAQISDVDMMDERISAPTLPEIEVRDKSDDLSEGVFEEPSQQFEEVKIRQDKEIKYTAGKDSLWFTDDDEVYNYCFVDYDEKGRVTQKSTLKVGPDNTVFTPDDALQDYQIYDYDEKGKVLRETSFDGQDVKQYAEEYTYDEKGKKMKAVRYDANNEEIRAMAFAYDNAGFLVQDVEYVGKDIQKYHRFENDKKGRVMKAVEFHRDHDGPGPDGAWFTADDVVSSAKGSIYDPNGVKSKDLKFIGPGSDGEWFTDDDELQYYTLYYHR